MRRKRRTRTRKKKKKTKENKEKRGRESLFSIYCSDLLSEFGLTPSNINATRFHLRD